MTSKIERRVRLSCFLALLSLALMIWSQLQPTPIPVIVAMSVGQGIGTLSLILYLVAITRDLKQARVLEDDKKSET